MVRGGRSAPQRIYQLLDLIRNDVIRRDTSPLPRPEAGFEALEMDHTAIYRAIAERDAVLLAEQKNLDADFEFSPQEPEFDEDASDESVPIQTDEEAVETTPTVAVAVVAESTGNGGFKGWMKRIFSGGEDRAESPDAKMTPITEVAVEEQTERQSSHRRGGNRSRSRGRGGRSRTSSSRSSGGGDDRRGRTRTRSRRGSSEGVASSTESSGRGVSAEQNKSPSRSGRGGTSRSSAATRDAAPSSGDAAGSKSSSSSESDTPKTGGRRGRPRRSRDAKPSSNGPTEPSSSA
jgi:hypothetical protein